MVADKWQKKTFIFEKLKIRNIFYRTLNRHVMYCSVTSSCSVFVLPIIWLHTSGKFTLKNDKKAKNIKNRRHLEASLKSEKGWSDFLAVAEPLLHLARLHLQQLAELNQPRVRRLHKKYKVKSSVVDLDPDPAPNPSIIKRNNNKNLDFYCFMTSLLLFYQCSGSGSVGSVCFWASWIRIRIH